MLQAVQKYFVHFFYKCSSFLELDMIKLNAANVDSSRPVRQSQIKSSNSVSEVRIAQNHPINRSLASSLNSLSGFNSVGRSSISFAGLEYWQTLSENYFKLPPKASPDKYQRRAADFLYHDKDVLVTAPTGTGKTAIAFYAITKNLEDGKRTFYTTPLKALSNEKYRQLQGIYGKENVGIKTGDRDENPNALIKVMTTEVYRNMVYGDRFKEKSASLENLKTVIFDELHYLGDADRGGVWEQSIILSDPKTQLLSLSATIGNKLEIRDWMSNIRGQKTEPVDVPSAERHVPLTFTNEKVAGLGENKNKASQKGPKDGEPAKEIPLSPKSYVDMVKRLNKLDPSTKQEKLPAIFFVFSKKASKDLLDTFVDDGELLTSKSERKVIKETIERYKKEGKYLGETLNYEALEKGYAIHNSGLLPAQKELIEELFNKKPSPNEPPPLKVVIATETLAAGINMPARTTVITSSRKPTSPGSADDKNDGKRDLTPNEFHQMAGRAGRRGIDKVGYVYTMHVTPEQRKSFDKLIGSDPSILESSFKPDYSFIAGYYNRTQDDDLISEIFNKSFFAHDKNAEKKEEKVNDMFKVFDSKKATLRDFEFMDEDNKLTDKGELLAQINGYEQIPVVNTIHDKKLADLTTVEFAACVGALANIDPKFVPKIKKPKDGEEEAPKAEAIFEHESTPMTTFVTGLDKDLEAYNETMSTEDNYKPIAQNKFVAKHLYEWAKLNSENKDSVKNWKEIMTGDLQGTIRDEGGLFREITQTVDLLKQMVRVAKVGQANAQSSEDRDYYRDIKAKSLDAIDLISHEPVPSKAE